MAKNGDPGVSGGVTAGPDAAAERKAAKQAARQVAKAEAELRKALKAAAKSERKAEKKAQRLVRAAVEDAKRAAKDAKKAEKKAAKAEKQAATEAGEADGSTSAAAAAGTMLAEVADLVRQAAEPAAAWIADRVPSADEPDSAWAESAPAPEPEPEPEPEAAAEPELEVQHEPEPEPELEPEPEAEAEPEPEPEAEAEPEPEPETAAEPEPLANSEHEWDPEPWSATATTLVAHDPVPVEPGWGAPEPSDDAAWPSVDLAPAATEPVADAPPAELDAEPPLTVPLPASIVGAAVDIGANSAHLLVAAVAGHRLEPLLDESAFLGLGDRVARDGYLGEAARGELVETLAGYADAARRLGAGSITLIGTEPIRRAADAASLVHEVQARAGVPLHVVDHDEEAMLNLLGVTGGRPVTSELLVIDIGGGSTDFVIVGPGAPVRAAGLRLGGARITQDHARSDPPTLAEIDAMRSAVRSIVVDAPAVQPTEIVAVGGTASNLLKLLPATAVDRLLTRRRITVALAMLTVERSTEAAERHLLRPQRARVLPAGALIVDAILEHYGVDRLRVSDEGIREGTILAVAAGGPAWRDRLSTLVAGWTEADAVPARS